MIRDFRPSADATSFCVILSDFRHALNCDGFIKRPWCSEKYTHLLQYGQPREVIVTSWWFSVPSELITCKWRHVDLAHFAKNVLSKVRFIAELPLSSADRDVKQINKKLRNLLHSFHRPLVKSREFSKWIASGIFLTEWWGNYFKLLFKIKLILMVKNWSNASSARVPWR